MIIKITKKMITSGQPLSAVYDPLAIAMRDMGYKNVTVGIDNVNCCDSDFKEKNFMLSDELQEWILKFDNGEKVSPKSFELIEV